MGTSVSFEGPKSGLVPSWVEDPASDPVVPHDDGTDGDSGAAQPGVPVPYPPIPAAPARSGLKAVRREITIGARDGDRSAVRRGARKYVSAKGGGRTAAHLMANSRAVARRIARVAHSFVNLGASETLRQFHLGDMAGAPAEDVFVALTDMLCPAGGTIEEAIARDAMLETVAVLAAVGVGNFDELSVDDLREFFIGVVSRSIEVKIFNEVGTNAVSVPDDIDGVERVYNMLHDFIERCVRDEFEKQGGDLGDMDGDAIDSFVDNLYAATLDLIESMGEDV